MLNKLLYCNVYLELFDIMGNKINTFLYDIVSDTNRYKPSSQWNIYHKSTIW